MRVPVILVVPTHEHFQASAKSAMTMMSAGLDTSKAPQYPGVVLDAHFAPVPLGPAEAGGAAMGAMAPETSKFFAIRGYIETTGEGEPPTLAGDAKVYADPQIRPMLTCGGSKPVGDATTVAAKLDVAHLRAKSLTGKRVAVAVVDTGINLQYLQAKLG